MAAHVPGPASDVPSRHASGGRPCGHGEWFAQAEAVGDVAGVAVLSDERAGGLGEGAMLLEDALFFSTCCAAAICEAMIRSKSQYVIVPEGDLLIGQHVTVACGS